jgi:RNA polymerase sigma-70 factor (ECF subfamily)
MGHPWLKLPNPASVYPVDSTTQSDEALARQAAGGDGAAFDELIARLTPFLFRLVRSLTSDSAEAEAIVQDSWLRAWAGLAGYRGAGFRGWMASIALNRARDSWRKRRPWDFADLEVEAEEIATQHPSPETVLERRQALERLARGVEQLPVAERIAVRLRYDAGFSYEEVAQAMAIPINTVRTHLHRAKGRLRTWMEADD